MVQARLEKTKTLQIREGQINKRCKMFNPNPSVDPDYNLIDAHNLYVVRLRPFGGPFAVCLLRQSRAVHGPQAVHSPLGHGLAVLCAWVHGRVRPVNTALQLANGRPDARSQHSRQPRTRTAFAARASTRAHLAIEPCDCAHLFNCKVHEA